MMKSFALALLIGAALDALLGDPAWLHHPVCVIGSAIARLEKRLRARGGDLRKGSVLLTAAVVLGTMAVCAAILLLAYRLGNAAFIAAAALLDWMGLAGRTLAIEAHGVTQALQRGGVPAGRTQVARIVGRDTAQLSEEEILCAAVETVAENTTDGVISPMIYALLGGPVLLWGFKAVSTLDSMVGYLDEHYRDIGWSGAKLDDVLNYLPARLTAGLMILAAGVCGLNAKGAYAVVKRDHANHKSPNCAWSEAAAAGALGIRLGGTHLYFGKPVEKPTIGDDTRPVCADDVHQTVKLMGVSAALMLLPAAAVLLL